MIIVRLSGGMGNQMFQYALGRSLSIKNNAPLGLDLAQLADRTPRPISHNFVFRNYDLDVFSIKAEILPQSKIPFKYRWYFSGKIMLFLDDVRRKIINTREKEKSFRFDENILYLKDPAYLQGYWQSPKYFSEIEDIIREDFELKAPLSKKVQTLKAEIESLNALCINVRRADFVQSDYHGTMENDYYDEALKKVTKSQKIDKIYIFSDDIEWCKNNLNFKLPTMHVEHEYKGNKFEEYLYLMASCKHFIIPNSSFAWWGAWLSNYKEKMVIAPKKWFNNSIDTSDLIPEEWIRI